MTKRIKKSLVTKFVSVLIAIFLWSLAVDNENPIITVDLSVPLRVVNESALLDKGLGIRERNFPRSVVVTIKGREDRLLGITSDGVEATIDLAEILSVNDDNLDVKVMMNQKNVSLENVSPSHVGVTIEEVGQNYFSVEAVPIGSVKKGYKLMNIQAMPQHLAVHDANYMVKSIGSLKVFMDINNLDRDIEVKRYCKAYDMNGAEIAELNKKFGVSVRAEIAKEVPIVPSVSGKLAGGYMGAEKIVTPGVAYIKGTPGILGGVEQICTEPISIDGATQTLTRMCAIDIPSGISVVDTPASVLVKIVVVPIAEKKFDGGKKSDIGGAS